MNGEVELLCQPTALQCFTDIGGLGVQSGFLRLYSSGSIPSLPKLATITSWLCKYQNSYMCVYVCVYVCVYMCVYLCLCVSAYLHVCVLCVVNTEAPVEALAQTSGMAELSSLIQSNVVAEHMGGACSDPIPERGLSAAQIASISQSDKIQHFSKEIILMLPNGKGGSFYSSRNVKDMMEGAGEMHTHASCLEIAFTEWSRNEQVPDSVELLQKLIEDDDNWQSDMEDARYDFERIIYQS